MEETPACYAKNETEYHIRNLVLNSNITITTAQTSQHQKYGECKRANENSSTGKKTNSCSGRVLSVEKSIVPIKRHKLINEEGEESMSLNPFASLPISLISNGTLSVTSESACVAIENGVPILKEAYSTDKLSFINSNQDVSATTLTPIDALNSTTGGFFSKELQENEQFEVKNAAKDFNKYNIPSRNAKPPLVCSNDNQGSANSTQKDDKYTMNQKICNLLSEETLTDSFFHTGLIPSPNQIDFVTLLGLEIVVNSCCQNEIPKDDEPKLYQTPTLCAQCQTDFTTQWHFRKGELGVQCNRCFAHNEHQIRKAKQTVLLTKEYTKTSHANQQVTDKSCTAKSIFIDVPLAPLKSTDEQDQHQLFEKYVKMAGAFSEDDYINDLTKLGAWIASNSSVFQAAKTVNSLNHLSTPLTRARAVQNLQVSLFEGLHHRLSFLNPIEFMMQEKPLLCCQLAVARMFKQADFSSLLSENRNANTPLEPILRAIEAQQHSLIKTILYQVPTTSVSSKIDN